MRRVRDRERKYVSRKTHSGQFKRRLEYQARCARREGVWRTLAGPRSSAAADKASAPVGDYRSIARCALSSAAEQEPTDDPKTPADS
jgi:hypothetical protein